MKSKKKEKVIALNQWELLQTPLSQKCFVDGKLALTPKYGDPSSKNYSDKVRLRDGERFLCSSYLEGSECLGKGKEKSWDYLIIFLRNKFKRIDYIKKNSKKNIVTMKPDHDIYLAFLEVHSDAGEVLEKYDWLRNNVIVPLSIPYQNKYKIFWLQSNKKKTEPTKERLRQMNDSPIKQLMSDSLDLDLHYK